MENVIGLVLAIVAGVALVAVTGLWRKVKRIEEIVDKVQRKGSER